MFNKIELKKNNEVWNNIGIRSTKKKENSTLFAKFNNKYWKSEHEINKRA